MGIAGLWSAWRSPKGVIVHSSTMLTGNADEHPLMKMFHKPADEKSMIVILPEDSYGSWLTAKPEHSWEFMREYAAQALQFSVGVPTQGRCFYDKYNRIRLFCALCVHGQYLPQFNCTWGVSAQGTCAFVTTATSAWF